MYEEDDVEECDDNNSVMITQLICRTIVSVVAAWLCYQWMMFTHGMSAIGFFVVLMLILW